MQTMIEDQFQKCVLAAPDHILVATDLTDLEYLVPHAIAQARACGAQVTFIHAISPGRVARADSKAFSYRAVSSIDPAKVVRDARLTLLGVERQVEADGITCEMRVRHGNASEVIRRELSHTGATRLIVGTHGRGEFGHLTLGPVTHQLLTSIDIPVFVAGPHTHGTSGQATPRRLLHPVSLMGDYQDSVQLALNVAQTCRAELTLLHVIHPDILDGMNPERILEWAGNALRALAPSPDDLVPRVNTLVTCGEVAEEILKTAKQIHADWIVLGAEGGYRAWPFHECGAYRVLAASACPVLTCPNVQHYEIDGPEKRHFASVTELHQQDSIADQRSRRFARIS